MASLDAIALAGMRTDMEAEMTDTIVIERIDDGDRGTVNRATGELSGEVRLPIYDGIGDISPIRSRRDRFDAFGESLIFTRQYRIKLPYDAPQILVGDLASVTSSEDSDVLGREFEVRDVQYETDNTARIVTVHDSAQ
jgi:hypothetical protein